MLLVAVERDIRVRDEDRGDPARVRRTSPSRCAAAPRPRSADARPDGLVIERVPPALERCLPLRSSALFSSRSSRAVSSARSARRMLPRAVKPSPATRISSACRFAAKRLRCSSTNTTPQGSWSSAHNAASLSTSRSAKRRRIRSARCRCGSSTRNVQRRVRRIRQTPAGAALRETRQSPLPERAPRTAGDANPADEAIQCRIWLRTSSCSGTS